MIEAGDAVDRLEHEIAGIERHDDLMIALGAKFLAQQLAVARRMLPVDEAAVEAGRVFAQRLELGAFALLNLGLDAVDRLLNEELQRRAVHAADIGQHVDGAVHRDAAGEFDQRQRSAPAQPDLVDVHAAAPPRHHRQRDPRLPPGRKLAGHDFGRLDIAALFGDRLEADRRGESRRRDRHRGGAAFADIEPVGRRDFAR